MTVMINKVVYVCLGLEMLATDVFIVGSVGAIFQWFQEPVATGLVIGGISTVVISSGALLCCLPFYEGR